MGTAPEMFSTEGGLTSLGRGGGSSGAEGIVIEVVSLYPGDTAVVVLSLKADSDGAFFIDEDGGLENWRILASKSAKLGFVNLQDKNVHTIISQ